MLCFEKRIAIVEQFKKSKKNQHGPKKYEWRFEETEIPYLMVEMCA